MLDVAKVDGHRPQEQSVALQKGHDVYIANCQQHKLHLPRHKGTGWYKLRYDRAYKAGRSSEPIVH